MADYAAHYAEIRAAGADVAAVSVDSPQKSEEVRKQLHLPFAMLSDADKQVIQNWGIYNPHERGGIAKPSVFIVDRNRTIRFASVDRTNSRVPTSDIVRILQMPQATAAVPARSYFPHPMDFARAIRNNMRLRNGSFGEDARRFGPAGYQVRRWKPWNFLSAAG